MKYLFKYFALFKKIRLFHSYYWIYSPDVSPLLTCDLQIFFLVCSLSSWAFQVAQWWKTHLPMQEMWVRSLGWEDPLEKEMATHSSISYPENPMDRGARWATVHGVTRSRTCLSTHTQHSLPFHSFSSIFHGANTSNVKSNYFFFLNYHSTLAWKIPWTEGPGGLQSIGSLRIGYDWASSLSLFTFMHWRRKWQPTPVFLPGESQGWGSLVGCHLWGCTESDTTEAT